MKIPVQMIDEGLQALARARELGALVYISHHQSNRMSEEELDYVVRSKLATCLVPRIREELAVEECIQRSSRKECNLLETGTEFRAHTIVVAPEDYHIICRLLRRLKRDLEEETTPAVVRED